MHPVGPRIKSLAGGLLPAGAALCFALTTSGVSAYINPDEPQPLMTQSPWAWMNEIAVQAAALPDAGPDRQIAEDTAQIPLTRGQAMSIPWTALGTPIAPRSE